MYRLGIVVCLFLLSQTAFGADKPRVFIEESSSWQMVGANAEVEGSGGGGFQGGARPQRVEIMKTFNDRCPQAIVTIREHKADFIVFLEHEGGKALLNRDNKVAVFNKDGDLIFANSTRSLGNSVKDACNTISGYSLISKR